MYHSLFLGLLQRGTARLLVVISLFRFRRNKEFCALRSLPRCFSRQKQRKQRRRARGSRSEIQKRFTLLSLTLSRWPVHHSLGWRITLNQIQTMALVRGRADWPVVGGELVAKPEMRPVARTRCTPAWTGGRAGRKRSIHYQIT